MKSEELRALAMQAIEEGVKEGRKVFVGLSPENALCIADALELSEFEDLEEYSEDDEDSNGFN